MQLVNFKTQLDLCILMLLVTLFLFLQTFSISHRVCVFVFLACSALYAFFKKLLVFKGKNTKEQVQIFWQHLLPVFLNHFLSVVIIKTVQIEKSGM